MDWAAGCGAAADRSGAVAARRTSPPGRRVGVRHQRHERPPDRGAGAPEPAEEARAGAGWRAPCRGCCRRVAVRRCGDRPRRWPRGWPAVRGRRRVRAGLTRWFAGDGPGRCSSTAPSWSVRAGRNWSPGWTALAAGEAHPGVVRPEAAAVAARASAGPVLGVPWPGVAVGGHGCRAAGVLAGLRRPHRRVRAGAGAVRGLVPVGGAARGRR